MGEPINYFPDYRCVYNKETHKYENYYRGINLGRGGWVYSEPGIYTNVVLLDAASMHPSSIIMLNKLGDYTKRYEDLKMARVYIKHKDYESAGKLFDGKLQKYLTDTKAAKSLSKALKLPINGFYGLCSAGFENPARDPRDVNNIVALRGALFMKTLFDEIDKGNHHIVHVRTDSCKIPDGDPDIVKFVQEFGKKYGYEMEHEAVYERICIVDKSNYVAAYMKPDECKRIYGYAPDENVEWFDTHDHPWTATGDFFQRPYVFKTLFTGEPIEFRDRCMTKVVKDAAMYLDMNERLPDVSKYETELSKRIFNETSEEKKKLKSDLSKYSNEELEDLISKGHDYQFIGRAGSFFPVRKGSGGGLLYSLRHGKYGSVTGTKGYRWLESEHAKILKMEDKFDPDYFDFMVDDAIETINHFGSFDRFIDLSRPYIPPDDASPADDDNPPWSLVPCGDGKYNTCMDCPNCKDDLCKRGYSLTTYIEEGTGC